MAPLSYLLLPLFMLSFLLVVTEAARKDPNGDPGPYRKRKSLLSSFGSPWMQPVWGEMQNAFSKPSSVDPGVHGERLKLLSAFDPSWMQPLWDEIKNSLKERISANPELMGIFNSGQLIRGLEAAPKYLSSTLLPMLDKLRS